MSAVSSAVTTLALRGYSINSIPAPVFVLLIPIAGFIVFVMLRRLFVILSDEREEDDNG